MKRIYFDNAATAPIKAAALKAMEPWLADNGFGNPSSIYEEAQLAARAVEKARNKLAELVGCSPAEVFFTSGGTESDNWAIKGAYFANIKKGKNHIITTNIEHHAVLHVCKFLQSIGAEITYLPADENGLVAPEQVREAITDKTCLVSVMAANNEIGTLEPINEIGTLCREAKVLFHTDAVQAFGHVPVSLDGVDLMSLSGHKLGAPKGVGALYIRKGVRIASLMHGGAQERGKRAGTENVAGICAFVAAAEECFAHMDEDIEKVTALRDMLIENLTTTIPKTRLNGDRRRRLPGNVNISFEGIEGESILLHLDLRGIAASSGSACTSGSLDPSHVLLAIGLPHELAHGSLRLSLSAANTEDEVKQVLEAVPPIIELLRNMSPVWSVS